MSPLVQALKMTTSGSRSCTFFCEAWASGTGLATSPASFRWDP
jgi:hypothetical protein